MSDTEEHVAPQNADDLAADREVAVPVISIPHPSQEVEELDEIYEQEFEAENFAAESETPDVRSERSISAEKFDSRHSVRFGPSDSTSLSIQSLDQDQQHLDYPLLEEDSLSFLKKVKVVKDNVWMTMKETSTTVKVVLIPVGQEIKMPFRVDAPLRLLKDHFSHLLCIPRQALQLTLSGNVVGNNDTLLRFGIKPQEAAQVEICSTQPEQYPVKRIEGLSEGSQIITVTIQTSLDNYEEIAVEIIKSDFHKPFLGGFRHKLTGVEFHNAGTQTVPKKIPEKPNLFCRDTQTVSQRKKLQQTTNTTSTQMTKIGVYVSNLTDKLIKPSRYFSAKQYHDMRLRAVLVIQTNYRRWHAKCYVDNLRKQKQQRLEWEEEEELKKVREKEDWIQMDYYRRHNPKTKEDFELLYNALELWRQEELAQIDQYLSQAERKAALCELLEKETQIIASIGRHRQAADTERQETALHAFLDKLMTRTVPSNED